MKNILSAKEREELFLDDLKILMNKHHAEIYVEESCSSKINRRGIEKIYVDLMPCFNGDKEWNYSRICLGRFIDSDGDF